MRNSGQLNRLALYIKKRNDGVMRFKNPSPVIVRSIGIPKPVGEGKTAKPVLGEEGGPEGGNTFCGV